MVLTPTLNYLSIFYIKTMVRNKTAILCILDTTYLTYRFKALKRLKELLGGGGEARVVREASTNT